MNHQIQLTREERLAKIGELLSKGISLLLTREAADREAKGKNSQGPESSAVEDELPIAVRARDDTESRILDYVNRIGAVSPKDVQRALELSKATAFRKLSRLVAAGFLIRDGNTNAIRYRITLK